MVLASSPGHSQLFNVRATLKSWEWPGDEANNMVQCLNTGNQGLNAQLVIKGESRTLILGKLVYVMSMWCMVNAFASHHGKRCHHAVCTVIP